MEMKEKTEALSSDIPGTGSEVINFSEESQSSNNLGKRKKIIIGFFIVFFLAISWVGTQQFAQTAVQLGDFDAPYFTTWIGTCWMTLCFPLYGIFVAIKYRNRIQISQAFRDSAKMFQTPRVSARQFFLQVVPMNAIWLLTNYLYIYGLKFIAATDASAIFASNVAFVYMLSICLIHERIYFIRILSCLLCISGVVLFAYVEGFAGGTGILAGVLMAVASAFGAAFYKVVFKLWLGNANLGQVSLYLSLLGASNALFMWTVFLILYCTGVEYFETEDIPWTELNASNFLGLVFNFTINFGVAYTYPLFISIAMLLGIPLNAVVDVIIKNVKFSALRLTAALLVIIGFAVMLLPDKWNEPIHNTFTCNKLSTGFIEGSNEEADDESNGAKQRIQQSN